MMRSNLEIEFDPFIRGQSTESALRHWTSVDSSILYDTRSSLKHRILWESIEDLRYLVLPNIHQNLAGDYFQGVSYYTNESVPDARCFEDKSGVIVTTISVGLVRQLSALATEAYIAFIAAGTGEDASDVSVGFVDLEGIFSEDFDVSAEYFDAFLVRHQFSESSEDPYLPLLFTDMLRFVWMHEWAHALAGHARLSQGSLGLTHLREFDRSENILDDEQTRLIRSLEFEADSVAIKHLLAFVLSRQDANGRLVNFTGTMQERIQWMILAIAVVMDYWSEVEAVWRPAKMRHPSATFRLTNMLDTARVELIKRQIPIASGMLDMFVNYVFPKMIRQSGFFRTMKFQIPGFSETSHVKKARAEADKYISILEAHLQIDDRILPDLTNFGLPITFRNVA